MTRITSGAGGQRAQHLRQDEQDAVEHAGLGDQHRGHGDGRVELLADLGQHHGHTGIDEAGRERHKGQVRPVQGQSDGAEQIDT